MTKEEFIRQQFLTLRDEIQASKTRAYWILIMGIVVVVSAGYLGAALPTTFTNPAVPFVLLVLILAFIVEQNGIIRAGRYLREQVEPSIQGVTGWEQWLESNPTYRAVDRYFFAGFIATFLGFFAIACSLSLRQLDIRAYPTLVSLCAATAYALGALCLVFVLIRHWHSCTTTADNKGEMTNQPTG